MRDVTRIVNAVKGEARPSADVIGEVYHELRRLAARKLAGERPDHTLQPTALVHEAWLRLNRDSQGRWNSRGHFFGAAAEAMRRILVEQARAKQSQKRGGGWRRVQLEELDVAVAEDPETVLAVNDLLVRLQAHDPAAAELVKLRFFAGMSYREAAVVLGVSKASAQRKWEYARAWLYKELNGGAGRTERGEPAG